MRKFTIALILTFLFIGLIPGGEFSAAAEPSKQETHGSNSPVAYTGKGNITITINEAKEICKAVQELIESSKNDKDIEISTLKKRIADIHQTQLSVLPQEADEWAEQFLSTLPLRKDKVIMQEKEETKRFEKERMNIPILFEYSINKFDEYISALTKHDKNITIEQDQIPIIIINNDTPKLYTYFKKISFPNGNLLVINISPGTIKNDAFISYPGLSILAIKNGRGELMLSMVHHYTLGSGIAYGEAELTDSLKKELTRRYDYLIERTYLGSPK